MMVLSVLATDKENEPIPAGRPGISPEFVIPGGENMFIQEGKNNKQQTANSKK